MNIVACYKCVPDDQSIRVTSARELDFSQAGWKVGAYDLNGVEAGMRIAEEAGGSVSVLTAAGSIASDSKMKKAILSRGPEQMYAVQDESLVSADGFATAQVLSAAVRKIGDVDLVLCGEGSGDEYSQQVGAMVGCMLGWSTVNAVSAVHPKEDRIEVERELETSVEVLEVPLPAVVSVTSSINVPRIAGMKDILAAGKKPATVWTLADVGVPLENAKELVSVLAPEQVQRENHVIEGSDEAAVDEFCALLKKAL